MYRATTPKHIFYFNVDPDESFSEILITYAQSGRIILEKHKSDLSFDEDKPGQYRKYGAWFRLTQQEANLFSDCEDDCEIQVRVKTNSGEVVAGPIQKIPVHMVLNDEVL